MVWDNHIYMALIQYNASTDKQERDRFYNTYLKEPFSKLVGETVYKYSDYPPDHEVHVDLLSMLVLCIGKMDSKKIDKVPDPPRLAHSYAETIVRGHLKDYQKQEFYRRQKFNSR